MIPVYQNFINFGSPLPLMAGIANTPFAILGSTLPVQVVQQVLLLGALLVTSFFYSTSQSIRLDSYSRVIPFSTLNLFYTSHYFVANDWSEVALALFGFQVLILLIIEANLEPFGKPLRRYTMLWIGASLASTDHLGHAGIILLSVIALTAISLPNDFFRAWIGRSAALLNLLLLSAFIAIVWYPSLQVLLQNKISSNPRPRPFKVFVIDFFTLGLAGPGNLEWTFNPAKMFLHLSAFRSLFLFVMPLLIYVLWKFSRLNRPSRSTPTGLILRSSLIVTISLAVLAVSGGSLKYPLRPSQDYFFRDAILLVLICGATLATPSLRRGRSVSPIEHGWKPLVGSVLVVFSTFLCLLVAGIFGKSKEILSSHQRSDLIVPGDCASLGDGALILSEYDPAIFGDLDSDTLWRRQQPTNPFIQVDCSLLQMVEDGQYSIAGWLKVYQTPSDGKPWFELDNITVSVPKDVLDSLDFYYLYDGQDVIPFSNNNLLELGVTEYERCPDSSCVLKILTAPRDGNLIWNFDPDLRFTGSSVIERDPDGFMMFSGSEVGAGDVVYDIPVSRKFSAFASWALWVAVPLANLSLIRSGRCR